MEKEKVTNQLDIIMGAISQVQYNLKSSTYYFLLWGWLVIGASVGQHFINQYKVYEYSGLIWTAMFILGITGSVLRGRKERANTGHRSYLDVFITYMWIVIGLTMSVAVYLSFALGFQPSILTLLLAGVGTSITGLISKLTPFTVGGIILILSSVICANIPEGYSSIYNAIAIAAGYIVPAYVIRSRKGN